MLSVVYEDICLLSNNINQPSTASYALSRHHCFTVLTNIDLFAFIPTQLVIRTLGLL